MISINSPLEGVASFVRDRVLARAYQLRHENNIQETQTSSPILSGVSGSLGLRPFFARSALEASSAAKVGDPDEQESPT